MRGHVSAGSFVVLSYSCKVNTMVFVILLQVRKVNFWIGSKFSTPIQKIHFVGKNQIK